MKNLQPLIMGLLGAFLGALAIYFVIAKRIPVTATPPGTTLQNNSTSSAASSSVAATPVQGQETPVPIAPTNSGATSKGVREVVLFDGAPAKPAELAHPYHRVFVLSVGVNRYPGALPQYQLRFATNDAAQVASMLRQKYGFGEVVTLLNEQATRDRILSELANIKARLSGDTNDDFIFFFSGHGMSTVEKRSATNEMRHGFLLPYDSKLTLTNSLAELQEHALELQDLVKNVIALPARHRILMLDSCFSGLAFVNQQASVEPPAEVYRQIIERPTVQILTAGLEGETAQEFNNISHGLFTYALLKQLGSAKVRSVDEVFMPLRVDVRDYLVDNPVVGRMTPQHRYLEFRSGTFVFVPTNRLDSWADQTPADPILADARQKGFYRPVEAGEVASLTNKTDSVELRQNKEWQATIERYEVRAAMGDPYAQTALADIYRRGIGTQVDTNRAKIWANESSDAVFAGIFNIKDPATAKLVDGILISALQNKDTAGQAMLAIWIMSLVNQGGGPSVDGIKDLRRKVLQDLQRPVPEYKNAQNHFQEWRKKLDELKKQWPEKITPPPEIDELQQVVQRAQDKASARFRDSATNLVNGTDSLIQSIESKIPKKPNK